MRISQDAAERVQTAAAELEYRPNRNARSLRTATTATIGVISDHVASGSYASRMLTGAFTAARDSNHLLVIGETEGDPDVERRLIGEMLDRQVDGVLCTRRWPPPAVAVPPLLADQRLVMLNCLDVGGGGHGRGARRAGRRAHGGRSAPRGRAASSTSGSWARTPTRVRSPGRCGSGACASGWPRPGSLSATWSRARWDVVPAFEAVSPRPRPRRPGQRPRLPERPDRDGGLPGARRARAPRAGRRGGGVVRRIGPGRLAAPGPDLGLAARSRTWARPRSRP